MVVDLEALVRLLISGLITGSIYTLLAVGLNIIFGVMKVVNFAQGEIMTLGAYVTFYLAGSTGLNPFLLVPISFLAIMGAGMMIERAGFGLVRGKGKLNEIFLSLALILILQSSMAIISVNALNELKPVQISTPYSNLFVNLGYVNVRLDFVIMISILVLLLPSIFVFLGRTTMGRNLRAVSQNRVAAALVGINVNRIDMISFGLGAGLAALAGNFLGMLVTFDPYSGTLPAIKAFVVIIMGGLGSIPGAIIAGFILGLSESFSGFFLGGSWQEAIAFVILAVILAVRPEGLFGESG